MNNEEYIKEREEFVDKIENMLIDYCDKYGNEEFVTLMLSFFLATIDLCCDLDDNSKATLCNPIRNITIHPVNDNNHNKVLN